MKRDIICSMLIAAVFYNCKSKVENENLNWNSNKKIENKPSDEIDKEQFSDGMQEKGTDKWLGEGNNIYDPSQTLYFSNVFIYEYTTEGQEKEEFWIYHNTENGQLLYMSGLRISTCRYLHSISPVF